MSAQTLTQQEKKKLPQLSQPTYPKLRPSIQRTRRGDGVVTVDMEGGEATEVTVAGAVTEGVMVDGAVTVGAMVVGEEAGDIGVELHVACRR